MKKVPRGSIKLSLGNATMSSLQGRPRLPQGGFELSLRNIAFNSPLRRLRVPKGGSNLSLRYVALNSLQGKVPRGGSELSPGNVTINSPQGSPRVPWERILTLPKECQEFLREIFEFSLEMPKFPQGGGSKLSPGSAKSSPRRVVNFSQGEPKVP